MVITSDFQKLAKSIFTSWRHNRHVGVQKNKAAAILVSQTSPVGQELFLD